jgi:hypothetical protein
MSNTAVVFQNQEQVCPDGYFMYGLYKFARVANETFTTSGASSLSIITGFTGRM